MTSARVLLLLTLSACAPKIDLTADRAELLRLHHQARTAHLEKRADLLVAAFADSVMDISRGLVSFRSRAENERRFRSYFDRVDFQQWDDVAPPRIRISPDGQMAYVVVQKSVRLTSAQGTGAPKPEHTIFAWVEIYEKHRGKWTLVAVASTDQPGAA